MQVILKIDVSDEPGNSIEQIEQFISDEHSDLLTSKSKKFPPGHRIRIQQFVSELCAKKQSLGKRGHSEHKNKASKRTSDTSTLKVKQESRIVFCTQWQWPPA